MKVQDVYDELRVVNDPELGINIVDLGLVYDVRIEVDGSEEDRIEVDFSLTYPGCPLEETIRGDIQFALQSAFGVSRIEARVVLSPPWQPDFMSEEARISLGYPI